jgi:hypothetical protein
MAALIQIRNINCGRVLHWCRISSNPPRIKVEKNARELMNRTTLDFQDMFCSVVDEDSGVAIYKFQLSEAF